MLCIIDGRILNHVDQLALPAPEEGGLGLLQCCRNLAAELLPGAVVRVADGTGPAPADPDQPRWTSLYDRMRREWTEQEAADGLLLLCPSAGAVSRSLLERMLERMLERGREPGNAAVLASADRLHHNAHPSWVMRAEGRYDQGERTYEHDGPFYYLLDSLEYEENLCEGQTPLPTPAKAGGSQWLPELMLATEAVVLAPGLAALDAARAGGEVEYVASADCPDIPPIYHQPLFTMSL